MVPYGQHFSLLGSLRVLRAAMQPQGDEPIAGVELGDCGVDRGHDDPLPKD